MVLPGDTGILMFQNHRYLLISVICYTETVCIAPVTQVICPLSYLPQSFESISVHLINFTGIVIGYLPISLGSTIWLLKYLNLLSIILFTFPNAIVTFHSQQVQFVTSRGDSVMFIKSVFRSLISIIEFYPWTILDKLWALWIVSFCVRSAMPSSAFGRQVWVSTHREPFIESPTPLP